MRNILESEAVKKVGGQRLLRACEQQDNRWDFCKVTNRPPKQQCKGT